MQHKSNKKGIIITVVTLGAMAFSIFAYTIYSSLGF